MKYTSENYKKEMREPWRNRWLFNVKVDAIDNELQDTARIKEYSGVSAIAAYFDDHILDKNYEDFTKNRIATFERDLIPADGSYCFIDRNLTDLRENYQGYISNSILTPSSWVNMFLKINGDPQKIKTITLVFDEDVYPKTIQWSYTKDGQQIERVASNDKPEFNLYDDFPQGMGILNFKFSNMSKSGTRCRLKAILFGNYINVDNEDILLSGNNYESFSHPCSLELPNETLNVAINNLDNKYDFLDKKSPVQLLKEGQKVDLRFSYMGNNGKVENLDPYYFQLDSFSNKGSTFNITAVDFLRNENGVVNFKIRIGTTLDSIMKNYVIPNLSNKNFKIIYNEETFKSIEFKDRDPEYANWPLKGEPTEINTSVKDCLKMIASAASCVMRLDGEVLYLDPISEKNIGLMTIDTNMFLNRMPVGEPKQKVRHIRTYYYGILPLIQAWGNVGYWRSVVDTYYEDVKGSSVIYENPFIFSEEQAKRVSNDLQRYYNDGYSYDFEFIGDPSLESGDSIDLENRTGDMTTVLVEKHDISFTNGGVRGKITAKG